MGENQKESVQKGNNELVHVEAPEKSIYHMIYTIRGQQVMLDSDLAMLYQVETRVLNQAVKRNLTRFPERFRFQLSEEEYNNLMSQFVISNEKYECAHGGRRKLPYVFTEQGISMLSAVLRSDTAIQVSIKIMDTFVEMRRFLASNDMIFARINDMEVKQIAFQVHTEEKFDKIFQYISEHTEVSQKIYFDGQIYDAFSLLVDLVTKAKTKLILVDNYVDIGTLNILAKKNSDVEVIIYTVKGIRLSETDISNFNKQYPSLEIRYTSVFHDRFLIIDDTYAYHVGASIKDAGKKCFGVNLIKDERIVKDILGRLDLESKSEMAENKV
ncbi:MAG: ORF6N domain-containing protein [Lachnospiraceae bacterium]|nr:ORF6N domain-containing protein [Lachnospiraceae bacterium]